MGMYTSIVISARLKVSTPEIVITQLIGMNEGAIDARDVLGIDTHRNPIGGSSAYFPEPIFDLKKSEFTHEHALTLTLVSNLKNYDGEIEALIRWLRPYIESGHGGREWWAIVTYEEDESPTIHYL